MSAQRNAAPANTAPNKQRVRRRFEKALSTYDQHASAQQRINRRLLAMLMTEIGTAPLSQVLEIGCGSGDLSRLLADNLHAKHWLFNDLSPLCAGVLNTLPPLLSAEFIAGDAEQLSAQFTEPPIELLASASTVQWFDQPLGFIDHAAALLRPDGYLLFSTFLPDNLHEVRSLAAGGLHYPTLTEWQQRLSHHFDVLAIEHAPIVLSLASPHAVLKHLQATGVTATASRLKNRGDVLRFYRDYHTQFSDGNDGVTLTYAPLLVLAKRHA